jgi:hypothetical protein
LRASMASATATASCASRAKAACQRPVPTVICRRVAELRARSVPGALHGGRERAYGAGEVDALVVQQREQVIDERVALGRGIREAELAHIPARQCVS